MKKIVVILAACLLLTLTGCSNDAEKTVSKTVKGYGGDVTVTLKVADGKITDVEIKGEKETPEVGGNAIKELPAKIKAANSWDVDVVSGATVTSTAVKKATKEAMTEAGLLEEKSKGDSGKMSLETINQFLNESADMGPGTIANAVALIPISHINGPREEHNFYAFVNFKYVARDYIKYQVTYLSCTCRSADVNYWMTAYVELTMPESGKIDDAKIKTLSFDYDNEKAEHRYLAGYWGDSNPTPAGATYQQFKEQYIPFFIGKDYKYIKTLSTQDDIDPALYTQGAGREKLTLDTFSGSSVSTNNIIRMLNALFAYHATDEFFNN